MKNQSVHEDRRQGVALIIVLGFLSIMVMMAVAFLTQSRVERMVSNASLEAMRSRQIAQTAIASSMQDYLNALKSVDQTDTEHDIFLSGDDSGGISHYYSGLTLGDDRLLIGKVEDWLKVAHLDTAKGGGAVSDDIQEAEWIWVREDPGARSRILGRYAYAVFDMSGLLDANLLGADYGDNIPQYGSISNRNNVRRMLFDALDESAGGNKQLRLNFYRDVWRGFDTPAALLNLTDGDFNDGRNSGANRWLGLDMDEEAGEPLGDISALSPYSYSVLHLGSEGGQNLKIPCDAANIVASAAAPLAAISGTAAAGTIHQALQDYESPAGTPPQGTDYPSVKNVPMFNEVGIQVSLQGTATAVINPADGFPFWNYNMIVVLRTEFWYPFPAAEHHGIGVPAFSFTPLVGGDSTLGPASSTANIWVQLMGSAGGTMIPLLATPPPGLAIAIPLPSAANCAIPRAIPPVTITVPLTDAAGGSALLPQGMNLMVAYIQTRIGAPLMVTQGAGNADSTPSISSTPLGLEWPFIPPVTVVSGPLPTGGPPTPLLPSWEADDPRLNHDMNHWSQTGPTWGATNNATIGAQATAMGSIGYNPGSYFYCRNGLMESPAELGYIPTDTPWVTLDIFSDDGIRLMNRLICNPDVYELLSEYDVFFTNGTVNPYTRNTNVLNACFYGLDIREAPGVAGSPSGSELVNGGELRELVDAIMAEPQKDGFAGWARVLSDGHIVPDWNKNNRISALGNTWGLFNESDRIFVVAVIAQSIKESADETQEGNWNPTEDIISGERRAVALCWLDASAEGSADELTQEMNILMFQYLNE